MTFIGGPISIKFYFKVLLGLAKVGISNITEYYLGAMLTYLENRISGTFGWPQGTVCYTD